MLEPKPKCEYTVTKGNRILRCQSAGTRTLTVQGIGILFCPYHYSVIFQLIKRKERYEKLLESSHAELRKAIDLINEMRTINYNRGNQP